MAGTVTADQIEKLNYVIGPKATSLSSSVVRLHTASSEDKKWIYTGLCGALCFVIDRQLGGVAVFRMYDLNHFTLLFEAQLYFDFEKHYMEINDNFYCFPIPGNHCIGFSFADSDEGIVFNSHVKKYSPKHEHQVKVREKIRKAQTADQGSPKKKGLFSRLFGEKKPKPLEEVDLMLGLKISRPENAVHENHIGWDLKNQTFDLSQLSKELKRVFKKAGIRKKDLKDTNTALLIADAILNQPLPDLNPQKSKKPTDKGGIAKKEVEDISESRRSSSFSTPLKPLQMPLQANLGDPNKKGFQHMMSAMEKKPYNLSKQDENALTNKLATAIAQRRKALTKHDVESEEDDWSDDDL